MISRKFYLRIVVRVVFLAANALAIGWLVFGSQVQFVAIILLLLFILQVSDIIYFLNRTNRQIAFFFAAIRNDDSTLKFPERTGNTSLNELNASLNQVNSQIRQIKFDLQEQEHYFKTILEHISTGIITFNKRGTIFLSNTSAQNLLELEHLNHIDQIARIDKKLHTTFKELQAGDNRLVSFNGKNGPVQLSLKSTQFTTGSNQLLLVTIQDVKNEMDSKELESWIKLIRVLTHEIMNTVAPITSLSETILGYYKNRDDQPPSPKMIDNTVKGLEVINERGTGLISFVETYRKLTRIPIPDKKTINVKQLFEQITTLIGIESDQNNVLIESEVVPPELEISADKKQISQVLINLVKNALEALTNTKNGKILITGEINKNGRAQITVNDNGPGIPADLVDKIFIPFFTTKDSGSGIGLSLSRQIMQLHNGTVKVESHPQNTSFKVIF